MGTADFNGDGILDFYYPDNAQLNIVLGQSAGSYTNAVSVSLGAATEGCRAYDLNGDSFSDLVCVTPTGAANTSVTVFLSNGDGTFKPAISTSIPGSGSFTHLLLPIAAHDLNGDGHSDLVVFDFVQSQIYTLLGDGSGNFPAMKVATIPVGPPSPGTAVLTDLDGDGHLDLLFAGHLISFLGQPDGSFKAKNSYYTFEQCSFADFDKDGHLDAACASLQPNGMYSLVILHGNGDGTFNSTPIFSSPFFQHDFLGVIGAYDLNGDGILDILANSGEGIVVLFGQSGLQFSAPIHYAFPVPGTSPFNGGVPDSTLVADYNKDGILDVASLGANGIYITYGKSDGSFDAQPLVQSGTDIGYAAVADYNGDGIPDVVTSGSVSLQLNLGKGDGTFSPATAIQTSNLASSDAGPGAFLMTGDFNGDGHADLIATNQTSDNPASAHIFFGKGDGTFGSGVLATSTAGSVPFNSILTTTVADIDQDGKQDLVNVTGSVSPTSLNVFLSNGDGSFRVISTALPVVGTFSYYQSGPAAADFNGDGKIDLIVPANNYIEVLLGNGDGTFTVSPTALTVPSNAAPSNYIPAVVAGDFDHDGKMDFAILSTPTFRGATFDQGPTSIYVYYGNGDGTFASAMTAATLNHGYINMATSDFNGDGFADFAVSTNFAVSDDSSGDSIAIVHSLSGRTFSAETNLIAGRGYSSLAIADLNRDGLPDLLFANGVSGTGSDITSSFAAVINTGTTVTTLRSSLNPSTYSQSISLTAMIGTPANLTQIPSTGGTVTLNGLPGGSVSVPVTFASSGSGISGTAVYTTSSLPGGSYTVSAVFNGNNDLASSTSASLIQAVNPAPTTTTLTTSVSSPIAGQTVTYTAQVGSAAGTPAGTVRFLDGTTALGTVTLSSGGAIFTTSTLAIGSHSITAVYSANANFAPSSSSPITFTIPQPTYQISVQSPTLSVSAGAATGNTDQVSVTTSNGFSGTVNLTCQVAYTGSGTVNFTPTCALSPAAVQVAGATATSTLSLSTTLSHLRAGNSAASRSGDFRLGEGAFLAFLVWVGGIRRRSSWKLFGVVLVATFGIVTILGCGGKGSTPPVGTTSGSYNITISSTNSAGAPNPNALTIVLTVN
jgi:hypothetical protein